MANQQTIPFTPPELPVTIKNGSPVSALTVAVGIGITEVAVGVTVFVLVGVLVGVAVFVGGVLVGVAVDVAVGVVVGGVLVGVAVFVGVGVRVTHVPGTGVPLQGSGTSVGVLGTFVPIGVGSTRVAFTPRVVEASMIDPITKVKVITRTNVKATFIILITSSHFLRVCIAVVDLMYQIGFKAN